MQTKQRRQDKETGAWGITKFFKECKKQYMDKANILGMVTLCVNLAFKLAMGSGGCVCIMVTCTEEYFSILSFTSENNVIRFSLASTRLKVSGVSDLFCTASSVFIPTFPYF